MNQFLEKIDYINLKIADSVIQDEGLILRKPLKSIIQNNKFSRPKIIGV